jgi:triacylglycerol esterase/lipase EstA (alpha/beta hydrolase family)
MHQGEAVEIVLLLHGMGRTSRSMAGMHRYLVRAGYSAIHWDYPSMREQIEPNGDRLCTTLAEMDNDRQVSKIHLVTHSLGGIIVRHALSQALPKKLGRVVMLAPPNRGSRAARRLLPVLGMVMKPLSQLTDDPDSMVNQLPGLDGVEIGIIAAVHDDKARIEETHLTGQTDHLVVPGFHTFIMSRRDVQEQTLVFIRNGRFNRV